MKPPRLPARILDAAIEALRWPVAVLMVVLLVPLVMAWGHMLPRMLAHPVPLVALLGGAALYVLVWRPIGRKLRASHWLLALEHEVTHALFAVLTGHRVWGLRAYADGSGGIEIDGRGNWLIRLSPYFFPTAPIVLGIASALMPLRIIPWSSLAIGFAMAYHVRSMWEETRAGRSDIRRAGRTFAVCFLPGANLLTLGVLLSVAYGGWYGGLAFLRDFATSVAGLVNAVSGIYPRLVSLLATTQLA